MTLRLTNTLSRRVEDFQPLEPGKVSIYCCGVTVYDLCHLGHARSYIAWDVLRRYLIWSGYAVTFVQNYTDIDDKILNRAAEEGSSMEAVSERNIDAFVADMARLNILPADRMPRATRSLDAIRALISELEARGAAYSADGDVYFAVMKHAGYGKLSGRDLEQQQEPILIAGRRALSCEVTFSCLELLNAAGFCSVRSGAATLLIWWQCTDHELADVRPVFQSMTQSVGWATAGEIG